MSLFPEFDDGMNRVGSISSQVAAPNNVRLIPVVDLRMPDLRSRRVIGEDSRPSLVLNIDVGRAQPVQVQEAAFGKALVESAIAEVGVFS